MTMLKILRSVAYGFSAAVVFLALLYAFDIADVRTVFGPAPSLRGVLMLLGGLSLVFVGVGMLLARMGASDQPLE